LAGITGGGAAASTPCEGTVEAKANPRMIEKKSAPVAPSVVRFIKEVQKQSGLQIKVDNYGGHEAGNPPFTSDIEVEKLGKYSFDVHLQGLPGFQKLTAEGFYERGPLVDFFLAVDRAAQSTEIEWVALYKDFEVAQRVNKELGARYIGFAGGRKEGSIHHGPDPYLLHVHFNIMPTEPPKPRTVGP
jgi:hypothetical protein